MLEDVRTGKLPLRNPSNYADQLPYPIPQQLRPYYDQVDVDGLNKWLGYYPEWSVSYRFSVVAVGKEARPNAARMVGVMEQQREAILGAIRELAYDPKALPKAVCGRPGVKKQVRARLSFTKAAFDHAWKSLRDLGEIVDAP